VKVEDKRNGQRNEEEIGNLVPGFVVEFISELLNGSRTTFLRYDQKIGIILDRETLLPTHEKGRFTDSVPVAFFNGVFMWMPARMKVKCVDAKVTIDYFDSDEEIPHIRVEKGIV